MSVGSPARTPVVSPSRLGRYLERKLNEDRHLHYVGVQGELSNLRYQANGTIYFSLKDRDAVLNCVAFGERAATFPALENGADVIAYGEVRIYQRNSTYQLIANKLELAGVGALHAKYEELSRKLQREGLFDTARKRPLPHFPFRVALVGSPSGDGTRDFVTQARERAPHVALRLFATAVNGVAAVPEIVAAIRKADASGADLLVVVRGGGSYEDLFGFSDERVVRAIAACQTPTVAAIGHERDQPLIELAADARASTPSTAAQTVLPKRSELLRTVAAAADAARRAFDRRLERARAALERIEHRSPVADPSRLLGVRRQIVDSTRSALERAATRRIAGSRARLGPLDRQLTALAPGARLERRRGEVGQLGLRLTTAAERAIARRYAALHAGRLALEARNPEALLERGFATIWAGDRLVREPADAPPGTHIEARLARGTLHARVEPEPADGGEQIRLL